MIVNTLADIGTFLHAQVCYHFFITPLPLPIEGEYRDFAERACDYIKKKRTKIIHQNHPRHHVLHYFSPATSNGKKLLITHGWMSRAAYMVRLIRALVREGYEVYALDFPAHGESKGLQLTWCDAVSILHQILNNLGPFYGVIGHSFGGSMLLNTLNLSHQLPEWRLIHEPEKAILIASPTQMRTPVSKVARKLGLNGPGLMQLREMIKQNSNTDIIHLNYRRMVMGGTTPILCIHGKDDLSIEPKESVLFCRKYPYASLCLLPNVDHVGVLIDERVEQRVASFLADH